MPICDYTNGSNSKPSTIVVEAQISLHKDKGAYFILHSQHVPSSHNIQHKTSLEEEINELTLRTGISSSL